ncbi:PAS domain S-box protein [Desulfopila inferna]|uniref:PAS domain S-box protein n=1 Tax=Desulfopila inferna TaxID=468528 RepID=UPI0019638A79|nr:PAS domain S-box protein [Desulfopila inferna]MBM9603663.1 PAS domain S-box protein [Desulfopila inferna]
MAQQHKKAFPLLDKSHSHACIIFDNFAHFRQVAAQYILDGLLDREKCFMAVDTYQKSYIAEDFLSLGYDVEDFISIGSLSIVDVKESYFEKDGFNPNKIEAFWIEQTKQAVSEGYKALRVVGEATFGLGSQNLSDKLMRYENIIKEVLFPHFPFKSLCAYDKSLYPAKVIKAAIRAHPILFYNNELFLQNIHYIPPEIHFQESQELEIWLDNVRKNNENLKSLAEQETKFRLLFEEAPLPYQSLDENGTISEINQSWLDTLGYSKDEVIGRNFGEFLPPDYVTHFKESFQKFKAVGEVIGVEFEMVKKDGSTILVGLNGKISRGPQQVFRETHCIFHNITEQRQSEKAIQRQNILISGINSIFAAVVKNADDREFGKTCLLIVERVTESPLSLLGETGSDDLLDIAASNPTWEKCSLGNQQDSTNKRRLPHLEGLYATVFKKGRGFLTNNPASHPDSKGVPPGHPELKCFMAAPLKLNDKTTGMISVANREGGYTDEDLATLKTLARVISDALSRRRAQKALIDQEIRYRNLFMNSPDAIFLNRHDKITLVNNACIRLFGAQKAEDLLGRSPYELYHLDYHEKLRERIYRIRNLNESLPPYETKIVRLDGTSVEVEITSKGYMFGDSLDIHVILRNVTEKRRAAEELKRSNKELEEFAYAISHDLQEPIRSIIGFLQLFISKTPSERVDDRALMYLDRAIAASRRMKGLIDNLLSLSKVSTNGFKVRPTELNQVVGIVLENLHSTLTERNVEVICQDLPVMAVDADLIQRLFQNLMANAIKYNTSHAPVVEIGCRPSDDSYEFFVKDNGIGIEQKFQERIFRPFQRLHTSQEYEGVGMGLTLCKRIVERHHGRIWMESQPGQGSTIFFTLSASLGGHDC